MMRYLLHGLLCTYFVLALSDTAFAIREFKKAFEQHYEEALENADFKKSFRKAKCNLCHLKGEKKDVNNPYGDALSELIEGNADQRIKAAEENGDKQAELEKVLAEIDAAFAEVESQASPHGPTYGERIGLGLLPFDFASAPKDEDASTDESEPAEGEAE